MARRVASIIPVGVITVLAVIFLAGGVTDDKDVLRQTFVVDAVYYDTGQVQVSYLDKSKKTSLVTLEILGMEDTYHKEFSGSKFVEVVPFPTLPKYGWQVHPVVFEIDHQEFGAVQLKTEIHFLGDPLPPVIYGRP